MQVSETTTAKGGGGGGGTKTKGPGRNAEIPTHTKTHEIPSLLLSIVPGLRNRDAILAATAAAATIVHRRRDFPRPPESQGDIHRFRRRRPRHPRHGQSVSVDPARDLPRPRGDDAVADPLPRRRRGFQVLHPIPQRGEEVCDQPLGRTVPPLVGARGVLLPRHAAEEAGERATPAPSPSDSTIASKALCCLPYLYRNNIT